VLIDCRVEAAIEAMAHPLVFATVSGAHLYGFPSPDSDCDLRGVHVLPVAQVIGLETGPETIELTEVREGLEIDLVTHDAKKFFSLMLKRNGYVLEQLHSPLIIRTSTEHEELKNLTRTCLTRHHSHHYFGFAETQWNLFLKEKQPRVKPLLYVFRVLLTGIHLMRTGEIEANLPGLNNDFKLSFLDELIARKIEGPEKAVLGKENSSFYKSEYERLVALLETAYQSSKLPEQPTGQRALNELLIRLRLKFAGT
jgi:predicted nucleotidyltransferase